MQLENEYITLFGPRNGKMLKHLHPEIADYPEFKDLNNEEYFFVWLYASQSSSINPEMADNMRASIAAKKAFKEASKQEQYTALEMPEQIKVAIEKMKTFVPEARYIAKRVVQDIFHNIQAMAKVDLKDFIEEDEEGKKKINWSGRKQYIDSAEKISSMLPSLISQIEQGFGVDTKTGKEIEDTKTITLFHNRKKDNLN